MLSAFLPALRLLAHAAGGAVGGRPRAPARSITCSGCRGQDTAAGTPGRGRENPSERAHVLSLAWLSSSTSSVKKLLFSVLPALEEMALRRMRGACRVPATGPCRHTLGQPCRVPAGCLQGARLRAPARSHCLPGIRWPRCSGRRTRRRDRREPEPEHTGCHCPAQPPQCAGKGIATARCC